MQSYLNIHNIFLKNNQLNLLSNNFVIIFNEEERRDYKKDTSIPIRPAKGRYQPNYQNFWGNIPTEEIPDWGWGGRVGAG